MKILSGILLLLLLVQCHFSYAVESGHIDHQVYFDKTDFELHVFKIKGEESGNTLMIIGGIQGDEPGGYISADLYADVRLKKGNIIVVPRANLASILANKRMINEDMNRRFAESKEAIYEDKIVSVLKSLMQESDLLINLHEGSGYYSPKYINRMNNPMRFGQSIIADTEVYKSSRCNCDLKLKEMAERVIEKVNPKIKDEKLKFKFNNHNTFAKNSKHMEQRKSATYFALSTVGIPAFGVEASKEISDLSTKVQMHSLVINAFMKEMDIEFATPSIELIEPFIKYLLVKIGEEYKVLSRSDVLNIEKGETIQIKHIETNYDRGITVDVLGVGGINDYSKFLQVDNNTSIVIRKDSKIIGNIPIKILDSKIKKQGFQPPQLVDTPRLLWFVVKVGNEEKIVHPDEQLSVYKGDDFEIIDAVFYPEIKREDLIVNFVGYFGGTKYSVEDDMGLSFQMNDSLLQRFAIDKDLYHAYAKYKDEKVGKFMIKISRPNIKYFIFKEGMDRKCYLDGEKLDISKNKVMLYDIVSDIDVKSIDLESPCGTFKFADAEGKDLNQLMSCDKTVKSGALPYLRARKGHLVLGSLDIITH